MSDILPTVVVVGQDGEPLIINLSSYDEKKHKIYDDSKKKKNKKEQSQPKLFVVENDNKFIIADEEGNNVGAEFYSSKEEADEMLKLFIGE